MKIEKCHRNPMWWMAYVNYGSISARNYQKSQITPLEMSKFIKTLKVLKDKAESKIKGSIERTDK